MGRLEVGQVEQHIILVRTCTAAFAHLIGHGPGDDIARGQVLNRGGVAFHEPFALGIAEDSALTARRFGEEDTQTGQTRRVELEKLHVLERNTAAVGNTHAVTGKSVRVGGGLEDLARTAGGEDDGLGLEDV